MISTSLTAAAFALIKRGAWTREEDGRLADAVGMYADNWTLVSNHVQTRTASQCRHRRSSLQMDKTPFSREEQKRLILATKAYAPEVWKEVMMGRQRLTESSMVAQVGGGSGGWWSSIARHLPGRTDGQCRSRWYQTFHPHTNREEWGEEEVGRLKRLVEAYGPDWVKVAGEIGTGRTRQQVKQTWTRVRRAVAKQARGEEREERKRKEKEEKAAAAAAAPAAEAAAAAGGAGKKKRKKGGRPRKPKPTADEVEAEKKRKMELARERRALARAKARKRGRGLSLEEESESESESSEEEEEEEEEEEGGEEGGGEEGGGGGGRPRRRRKAAAGAGKRRRGSVDSGGGGGGGGGREGGLEQVTGEMGGLAVTGREGGREGGEEDGGMLEPALPIMPLPPVVEQEQGVEGMEGV